jgi:hypothetical protein
VAGGIVGRIFGSASAVDRHGQVVFAKGDHAAAECTDGAFAPHPLLELEADEDAQPEDQLANLLVGVTLLRECGQVVERRHQGIDLRLRRYRLRRGRRWRSKFGDLTLGGGLFRDEVVECLGDSGVAGVVVLGSHAPLGGRDVLFEVDHSLAELPEHGRFLGLGLGVSLGVCLRQQPLTNGLAAAGLVDEFDQGVDEHGRDRRCLDRVVAALGIAAVAVAAADILQLVAVGDAVHHAAAAVGQVDNPCRQRIAIRIGRPQAIRPTQLADRHLFRLQSPPSIQIELGVATAGPSYPHLLRVLQ